MYDWLEASHYNSALPDVQRRMRREALIPLNMSAEVPEAYRLWRLCRDNDALWWDGGVANQPYMLMLEFSMCRTAHAQAQDRLAAIQGILSHAQAEK